MGPRTSAWRSAGNPAGRRLPSGREARARLRGGHILRLTATTRRPLNWATIWLLGCMCVCVCVCMHSSPVVCVCAVCGTRLFLLWASASLQSVCELAFAPGFAVLSLFVFFLCSSLRLPLSLSLWLSFPRLGCLYLALRLTRSLCPTLSLLSIYLPISLPFVLCFSLCFSLFLSPSLVN